jgi:hypothetical protein
MSNTSNEQALTAYMELLAAKGVSLRAFGIQDVALKREDALFAVELLRHGSIPIMGGDVYFERGAAIELAYANWHTDGRRDEDRANYLTRSWDDATKYITTFPSRADVKPLFSLVVGR